jgi:hypothetical protein
VEEHEGGKVRSWLRKHWPWVAGGAAALAALLWYFVSFRSGTAAAAVPVPQPEAVPIPEPTGSTGGSATATTPSPSADPAVKALAQTLAALEAEVSLLSQQSHEAQAALAAQAQQLQAALAAREEEVQALSSAAEPAPSAPVLAAPSGVAAAFVAAPSRIAAAVRQAVSSVPRALGGTTAPAGSGMAVSSRLHRPFLPGSGMGRLAEPVSSTRVAPATALPASPALSHLSEAQRAQVASIYGQLVNEIPTQGLVPWQIADLHQQDLAAAFKVVTGK